MTHIQEDIRFEFAPGNGLDVEHIMRLGGWESLDMVLRYTRSVKFEEHDLDRADIWFKKRGTISVFISRILPVIRTFISLPAGIVRMNLAKFSIYTFIGSFIWSTGLTYGGYLLGEHWEQIRTWMRPFDIPILIVVVLIIAYYIYRHIRHFAKGNQNQEIH